MNRFDGIVKHPAEDFVVGNGGVLVEVAVEVLEPTGPDIYAAIRIGPHEVMARLPANTAITAGVSTGFEIDLNKASVFDAESGNAFH